MTYYYKIPGINGIIHSEIPSPNPGAVLVKQTDSKTYNYTTGEDYSQTHTSSTASTSVSYGGTAQSQTSNVITADIMAEIVRKAWSNEPLDNPTPQKQAIWNSERAKALAELARKAAVGQMPTDPNNKATWMQIIANQPDPSLFGGLGGIGDAAKNVTKAHPGLALGGAILLGVLLLKG